MNPTGQGYVLYYTHSNQTTMLINWTDEEREQATRQDVNIFMLNTTPDTIREMDAELPTDTHIIEYVVGEETTYDAIRAYKVSDVFDLYYDKFKKDSISAKIVAITNGYGRIKPKLYGYQAPESSSKKK